MWWFLLANTLGCNSPLRADQIGRNPGLQAIWEDEKQRRRERNQASQLEIPESQGEQIHNVLSHNYWLILTIEAEEKKSSQMNTLPQEQVVFISLDQASHDCAVKWIWLASLAQTNFGNLRHEYRNVLAWDPNKQEHSLHTYGAVF